MPLISYFAHQAEYYFWPGDFHHTFSLFNHSFHISMTLR